MHGGTRWAAAALAAALTWMPSAALAADTATTPGLVDATHRATNEAPDSLKQWAAEREESAPRKRQIAIVLILVMTAAGATSAYLMTKRTAELDRMVGDAHNRWMRDRAGVGRGRWER